MKDIFSWGPGAVNCVWCNIQRFTWMLVFFSVSKAIFYQKHFILSSEFKSEPISRNYLNMTGSSNLAKTHDFLSFDELPKFHSKKKRIFFSIFFLLLFLQIDSFFICRWTPNFCMCSEKLTSKLQKKRKS